MSLYLEGKSCSDLGVMPRYEPPLPLCTALCDGEGAGVGGGGGHGEAPGRAAHVDSIIIPVQSAYDFSVSKLECDEVLLNFAFEIDLRRYTLGLSAHQVKVWFANRRTKERKRLSGAGAE